MQLLAQDGEELGEPGRAAWRLAARPLSLREVTGKEAREGKAGEAGEGW